MRRLIKVVRGGRRAWPCMRPDGRHWSDFAAKGDDSAYKFNPSYFVHFGNVVALAALSQTDILHLRSLLVISTACGISYNLLQPRPLLPPALWGAAFLSLHLYMIAMLLRERQHLSLSKDAEEVYEKAFLPYGFTHRQFLDILEDLQPRWCDWRSGCFVVRRGSDMDDLHYLVEGEVDTISCTDDSIHKIRSGKGGWLGEFFDPNMKEGYWEQPHKWPVSWKCIVERCRTVAFPRKALHDKLKDNPRFAQAATKAAISDLWGKFHQTIRDLRPSTYRYMLQVALSDGTLNASEKKLLEEFKERHGISLDLHKELLEELGWTEDEFAVGHKSQPESSRPGSSFRSRLRDFRGIS